MNFSTQYPNGHARLRVNVVEQILDMYKRGVKLQVIADLTAVTAGTVHLHITRARKAYPEQFPMRIKTRPAYVWVYERPKPAGQHFKLDRVKKSVDRKQHAV